MNSSFLPNPTQNVAPTACADTSGSKKSKTQMLVGKADADYIKTYADAQRLKGNRAFAGKGPHKNPAVAFSAVVNALREGALISLVPSAPAERYEVRDDHGRLRAVITVMAGEIYVDVVDAQRLVLPLLKLGFPPPDERTFATRKAGSVAEAAGLVHAIRAIINKSA